MGFLGAVGLMVGAAGPATAQVQPPPRPAMVVVEAEAQPVISDATITANIKAKLLANVLLRNAQVTIATTNGKVTLWGMVPSDTARTEALEAARTTPGVLIIDDMLRLPVSSPQAPMQN
jgi:BON domain